MTLNIQTTFNNIEESEVSKETPLSSFHMSKRFVEKAGDTIREYISLGRPNSGNTQSEEDEFTAALIALKQYRELHSPSLRLLEKLLEKKLKRLGLFEESIIASRTKRLDSITNKLLERNSMRLPQMEDIVGIRVTLPDIQSVNKFIDDESDCEILNCEQISNNFSVNDYLKKPKDGGYRSIHRIFKCDSESGFKINLELQIRSKIQHEWATVVEILGFVNKFSYKAGKGDKKTLEFLKLTSVLFSIAEDAPIIPSYENLSLSDLCDNLQALDDELQVIKKLTEVSSILSSRKNYDSNYYLIQLDIKRRETIVHQLDDEKEANDTYTSLERQYRHSDRYDVVLVSVDDFKKIEDAYPNYFLNANDFVKRFTGLMKFYCNA